jgi:tRNA nucleotidyltransferase (CCA-adding enzyme)
MMSNDTPSVQAVVHPAIIRLGGDIRDAGGTAFIVGGWVRDHFLGSDSEDYDLEVYHLDPEVLLEIASRYAAPNMVGKAFGVIHLNLGDVTCDLAFPRTESRIGAGHRDFLVRHDPGLSFDVASARRDFTVNAMGMRLPDLDLIDCHGGMADLEARVLRHVSPAFSEDPLRVLRAVQFAARFNMTIAPETMELCRTLPLDDLSRERLYEEFEKLLMLSDNPSIGLEYMRELDVLRYYPELEALIGVPQNPAWHPEGDVWTHTLFVVDHAARLRSRLPGRADQVAYMFAALCHDFGKPKATVMKNGIWVSPGHEAMGEAPARSFMMRLTNESRLIEEVVCYVREHLMPLHLYHHRDTVTNGAIRRLALRIDIGKLLLLTRADTLGSVLPGTEPAGSEIEDWLAQRAHELLVLDARPVPFLTGRMLLGIGMKPGREIGELIRESFELQLDGVITGSDEALQWAVKKLESQV